LSTSLAPTPDVVVAPLGPAATLAPLPSLVLPFNTTSTPLSDINSSTKSVDEPPSCSPTLAPPMLYRAGADHGPVKLAPVRQLIAPPPPDPPMPMLNFLTPGRTMMQSALASTYIATSCRLSISCKTAAVFLSVSSSFWSSTVASAQAG